MNIAVTTISISAVWLSSEIILSFLNRAKSADHRLDKSTFRIIWIAIAISVSAGVYIGSHRLGRFSENSLLFALIGIAMMICGIILRWAAILTLKRQFTVNVAITQGHRLVKEGVYRFLRHPSYAGSLLSFLGLGLVFANYLSVIAIFVPICLALLYRIRVEERALADNFGAEYLEYCASTKRLIPYLY
jgi:protein-S-isoprenylcysteine O-methyltransferase Ste14